MVTEDEVRDVREWVEDFLNDLPVIEEIFKKGQEWGNLENPSKDYFDGLKLQLSDEFAHLMRKKCGMLSKKSDT